MRCTVYLRIGGRRKWAVAAVYVTTQARRYFLSEEYFLCPDCLSIRNYHTIPDIAAADCRACGCKGLDMLVQASCESAAARAVGAAITRHVLPCLQLPSYALPFMLVVKPRRVMP